LPSQASPTTGWCRWVSSNVHLPPDESVGSHRGPDVDVLVSLLWGACHIATGTWTGGRPCRVAAPAAAAVASRDRGRGDGLRYQIVRLTPMPHPTPLHQRRTDLVLRIS
jgi:hypothetical protein